MLILGRTNLGIGSYASDLAGAPNYVMRFKRFRVPRLLYHSGLDETWQYPFRPSKTHNFSFDVMPKVDFAQAKTLQSNLTQQWAAVENDVIIKEVYEGDLTMVWASLHTLYTFWRTVLGPTEYMLWRPLDLTDKVFRVQILNITVGGEDFQMEYVGTQIPEKWLTAEVQIHLKLLPTFPPSASVFAMAPLPAGG